MTPRQRAIIVIVLSILTLSIAVDVVSDWKTGSSGPHILMEVLTGLALLFGTFIIGSHGFSLEAKVSTLKKELETVRDDAEKWKRENSNILKGLGAAIDRQFDEWHLTSAEKEIAMLLLKGLSLKEIADVRQTSERTVRQQSLGIYQKSNLAGRAELAAFFLEDLMLPPETTA